MTLRILTILLLLAQGAPTPVPAPAPKVAAKGAIGGVVVNGASGDPMPNVRVTLAKIDTPAGMEKAVRGLIGGSPEGGGPRSEVIVPGEFVESIKQQMAAEVAAMRAAAQRGQSVPQDFPSEMTAIADLDTDGIHSLMIDASGKLAIIPKSAPPTTTDGAGRFEFRGLDPGTYRLIYAANGYARQDYGQRGISGGTPLLLEAGKTIDNLETRMVQTGTIHGRILNAKGKPAAAVPVQLSRFAYDATGKKKALPVVSTQTNDLGEYRFYFLTPGRYLLSAGTLGASPAGGYSDLAYLYGAYGGYGGYAGLAAAYGLNVGGAPASQNRVLDRRFTPAYYPGTSDFNAAQAIEVTPGGTISDINLVLAVQGAYIVRGRVIDPGGGALQSASIRLMPQDGSLVSLRNGTNFNPVDGTFEMREVPAGSYLLVVEAQTRVTLPQRGVGPQTEAERLEFNNARITAQAEGRLRASMPIVVENADVEGVVLTPAVGGALNGRIRVEGAVTGKPPLQLNRLGGEFRPAGADGSPTTRPGLQPQSQAPRPDGTFRVNSVYTGDYWFRVRQLPAGYYIKSARLGEADALNSAVTLPAADANVLLDVVVSPNVGQVEGAAILPDGRPAAGAQVVLVPDRNRARAELFRPVSADARGRFTIPDVEPGEYHLAVWQFMDPYAFFDPGMIAVAQEKGKAVRVEELSKLNVEVQAIPPPDTP